MRNTNANTTSYNQNSGTKTCTSCCGNNTYANTYNNAGTNSNTSNTASTNTSRIFDFSGITPPIGTLPPTNEIVPPIGTLPPTTEIVPPIGTLPPTGVVPPIGILPPRPEPPVIVPEENQNIMQVCLDRVTYIWLKNGDAFWAYPTEVSQGRLYGYRYNTQAGWFLYDFPYNQIQFIICTQ